MTRWRLDRNGGLLELETRRIGLRTGATLLRDSVPITGGVGLGRVLLPLPGPPDAGSVLVLAAVPGVVARAVLLVPRPVPDDDGGEGLPDGVGTALDLARAERHPFDPPPGTLAARLRGVQQRHPRLWAARHVVLAAGRVLGALLGLALLLQLLLRPVLAWLARLLPDVPDIPWPAVDVPSIPWPDLPDVSLPAWLLAVLGTAKYWVPILIAVVLAVREVRRKTRPTVATGGRHDDTEAEGTPGAHR